jgi:hypothetical protein
MLVSKEPKGMETSSWVDQRRDAAARRQRPPQQQGIRIEAASDGSIGPTDAPTPTDLYIEATAPDGETAAWFDDWWWMECFSRWKNDRVIIHIQPTPAALLHPVVLHHVEMVRRIAPNWRVIGLCWLGELDLEASPEAIARSPYHEVRITDAPMPQGPNEANPNRPATVPDLVGAVRRAQKLIGRTLPVLTRESQPPPAARANAKSAPESAAQASAARTSGAKVKATLAPATKDKKTPAAKAAT